MKAVLASDDFDKDVFDQEHFVVCRFSAFCLLTATVRLQLFIYSCILAACYCVVM